MIFYLLVITVRNIEKTDIIFQKIKIKANNELDKIMDLFSYEIKEIYFEFNYSNFKLSSKRISYRNFIKWIMSEGSILMNHHYETSYPLFIYIFFILVSEIIFLNINFKWKELSLRSGFTWNQFSRGARFITFYT
jgi:hypothetical protein